jgi:hypothetical protein
VPHDDGRVLGAVVARGALRHGRALCPGRTVDNTGKRNDGRPGSLDQLAGAEGTTTDTGTPAVPDWVTGRARW